MTRTIFDVASACDPTAELEAPNLIPNTRLRPADILTGALGNGRHALDIGICSPDAVDAGDDCVDTMFKKKNEYYSAHTEALALQNIEYKPLMWSAYGRPHDATTSTLRTLAKRLTRRRGGTACEWRYERLRSAIGVEIMRRGAACVRHCWMAKQSSEYGRRLDLE